MANRNDSNGLFFRSLPAAVLCLCAALFARADVPLITTGDYVVDPVNGVDSIAGGNTTFKTIQFAIASAASGKTILIKKGHYLLTEPLYPKSGTSNRQLSLLGENPNEPRDVLIDGQAKTTCIISTGGSFTLSNLCVTNGLGGAFTDGGPSAAAASCSLRGAWKTALSPIVTSLPRAVRAAAASGGGTA